MRDVTARVEKESKDFKGDSGQMRGRKIRWRLLLPDARARIGCDSRAFYFYDQQEMALAMLCALKVFTLRLRLTNCIVINK